MTTIPAFIRLAAILLLIMFLPLRGFQMGKPQWSQRLTTPRMVAQISEVGMGRNHQQQQQQQQQQHQEEVALKNRLPSLQGRRLNKLEMEFRQLLEGILYTSDEIEAVTHPRMRTVLEGIAASYHEPAVYRAFEVLFCDVPPLRLAGRIVYGKLRNVVEESTHVRRLQLEAVMQTTGMTQSEAQAFWSTFVEWTESDRMSAETLEALVGPATLSYFNCDSEDEILNKLNPHDQDSLSFEELVNRVYLARSFAENGTQSWQQQKKGNANLLQEAFADHITPQKHQVLDSQRQKHNQRYDDMLEQFAKWKDLIPSGEGRRMDILKGCFVGSENPKVVEALRVIYVDYAALRVSGDWIFKTVSLLINAAQRRPGRRRP